MQVIIVPLDFSQTSFNAAHYAYNMYKNRAGTTLILYHFYKPGEDVAVEQEYLESLKKEFSNTATTIETKLESGDNFIDSLSAFAHVKTAHMIIMGLTGKTPMAQRFSGSNTLKMAEKNVCPVLIIPEQAVFNGIANVVMTSQMKYVEESPALLALKNVLAEFKPALHVLNVDSSHYVALTPEFKEERDKMEELLAEFKPEFYFMRLYDFNEAVNLFTEDKNIDMIIISPKYHSFFERLFKTQHTKPLIYHSRVPVLAIQE
jgi:nucleotide-binding universal stress UspA family protein